MKWFNDLIIRWKLILGFGIIIVFTIVLAFVSVLSANSVDDDYSYLLGFPQQRLLLLKNIQENFVNMRRLAVTAVLESENPDLVVKFQGDFNEAYDSVCDNISKYLDSNNNDKVRKQDVLQSYSDKITSLKDDLTTYKTSIAEPAMALAFNGKLIEAKNVLASGGSILNEASEIVNEVYGNALEFSTEYSDSATARKNLSNTIFLVLATIIVILSIIIAFFISRVLTRPLHRLLNVTDNLVRGNLNVNKAEVSKDEIGQLTVAIYKLIDIILLLIKEMSEMAKAYEEGDIDAAINVLNFEGSYKTVAEGVNNMTGTLVQDTLMYMDCLKEFGGGNFNANIPLLPGKKVIMNENLNNLRNNLKSIAGEIGTLVNDASVGKLSSRANIKKYSGDWAELLKNLNKLMEAVVAPINESAEVLRHVSAGNFEYKVNGNYKGDFLLMKNSINDTITNVASYINEISDVLGAISNDDNLAQEITREYVGKFSEMKVALNSIIDKFNRIISDIFIASDQVAAGAKQVSESSMTLAQGASEQASSIEELNATVITINDSTTKNAESAKSAEGLAVASQDNAKKGNSDMNNMLVSMDAINDSSNNIAKIIKVIDDIAFQTNLLALNAAVEAARAGEHGKGFAVVAEEVRNLAGRSQNAAKETAGLIEESINKVNEGTKMARTTADALHAIVDNATEVSNIITSMAEASNQQADAISQITNGLSQITEVVQNNSATSEESASASEELSSQAEVLKNLVSVFKLKKTFYN